jgi:hypothetical protein
MPVSDVDFETVLKRVRLIQLLDFHDFNLLTISLKLWKLKTSKILSRNSRFQSEPNMSLKTIQAANAVDIMVIKNAKMIWIIPRTSTTWFLDSDLSLSIASPY